MSRHLLRNHGFDTKLYIPRGLTPSELEEWDERAAILEFDAGRNRARAEREAEEMVITRRKLMQTEMQL